MYWRVSLGVVLASWILLAVIGDALPIRQYVLALGGTMTGSIIVGVRGPAWHAAMVVGRRIERKMQSNRPK